MSTIFPNSKVQIDATFKLNGVAQNPSGGVTFQWRMGRNGEKQTVAITNIGAGQYRAEVTPTEGGHLFYKFEATGDITKAIQGRKTIEEGYFENAECE